MRLWLFWLSTATANKKSTALRGGATLEGGESMKFETQTHYQRFMLGIICGLLPFGCLLFGLLGAARGINYPEWYNSISATYFSNGNMCMIGALCLCSFFLFTYQGYEDTKEDRKLTLLQRIRKALTPKELFRLTDRKLTLVAAVSALLIVACPCAAAPMDYMGLFALPTQISNVIHMVAAIILFGSFALMTLTQFPKGTHKRRNTIYRICGWTMLAFMAVVGLATIFDWPGYMTMICEAGMLEAFAVAWIIKSGVYPKV